MKSPLSFTSRSSFRMKIGLPTSARFFQQNFETKSQVFELRVAKQVPMVVKISFKEVLDVPERNERVLHAARERRKRPKAHHADGMATMSPRSALFQESLNNGLDMFGLAASESGQDRPQHRRVGCRFVQFRAPFLDFPDQHVRLVSQSA